MSAAKHPHTITCSLPCVTVRTTHAVIICSPTLCFTKTGQLEPKISHLDSSDQRTDFHRSNVYCSCFLAQASLFFLLVSFSSGCFAAIQPWRPDSHSLLWTVDVDMCLLPELCEAFIWAAIGGAINSNELILCSRGNSASSFPVAVLMRASVIIALFFCDCTWRNFHSSWNVPDWLTFMS